MNTDVLSQMTSSALNSISGGGGLTKRGRNLEYYLIDLTLLNSPFKAWALLSESVVGKSQETKATLCQISDAFTRFFLSTFACGLFGGLYLPPGVCTECLIINEAARLADLSLREKQPKRGGR